MGIPKKYFDLYTELHNEFEKIKDEETNIDYYEGWEDELFEHLKDSVRRIYQIIDNHTKDFTVKETSPYSHW